MKYYLVFLNLVIFKCAICQNYDLRQISKKLKKENNSIKQIQDSIFEIIVYSELRDAGVKDTVRGIFDFRQYSKTNKTFYSRTSFSPTYTKVMGNDEFKVNKQTNCEFYYRTRKFNVYKNKLPGLKYFFSEFYTSKNFYKGYTNISVIEIKDNFILKQFYKLDSTTRFIYFNSKFKIYRIDNLYKDITIPNSYEVQVLRKYADSSFLELESKLQYDSLFKNEVLKIKKNKIQDSLERIKIKKTDCLVDTSVYILLDYWYIGCPPCQTARKELEKLYLSVDTNKIKFYAINTIDSQIKIDMLSKKRNYRISEIRSKCEFLDRKITAYPTIVLLDKNHKVYREWYGLSNTDLKELKKLIMNLK